MNKERTQVDPSMGAECQLLHAEEARRLSIGPPAPALLAQANKEIREAIARKSANDEIGDK